MSQSLANLVVHLVFSTKHREQLISDEIRGSRHSYMAGVFQGIDSPALIINSVPDHVHAMFMLSRKLSLMDVVEEIKTKTSKWMKTQAPIFADFYWQNGYGAFSVSQSKVEDLRRYITNQVGLNDCNALSGLTNTFVLKPRAAAEWISAFPWAVL